MISLTQQTRLGMTSTQIMGARVSRVKLPYIQEYRDREGKFRRYVRRKGMPRIALPGFLGSPEFMEAYQTAMSGTVVQRQAKHGPGSLAALCTDYFRSAAFANLKPRSQATYRYALAPLIEQHGHRSVCGMDRERVQKIIDAIGVTRRGMAYLTRSVLHRLMKYAVRNRWRDDNPVAGTDSFKIGTHHTWSEEELALYEKRWPTGTRERLAYALLLFTDQRGGDVVRMKRSDVVNGSIRVVQEKTGPELSIPLAPELLRAIKSGPSNGIFLIGDKYGRPIKRPALTQLIRRAAREAGLPSRCVAHGLRKAGMRRLAERGATTKEIQAISG